MNRTLLWSLLIFCCFFIKCTSNDHIAGGSGSTTTNGFTARVFDNNNNVVSDAIVRIRPVDYYASEFNTNLSGTVADTFTGSDGKILFTNLIQGAYLVEVFNKKTDEGVVFRCDIRDGPVNNLGNFTIKPTGSINGIIDAKLLLNNINYMIQVYGMERVAAVDSKTGNYHFTNLPPAEYVLRVASSDSIFVPFDLDPVVVTSGDTVSIDPLADWLHKGILSIDNRNAGISETDTVFNFPLLLRLDQTNFDFSLAKKKGTDLRVTKENGSNVFYETEWWDSINSTAAIWIHVDTLYGNRPIQKLLLYWGNKKGGSLSNPSKVFDTTFGFRGVWHLNESGGTEQQDATGNNRIGIPNGMDGSNDIPGNIGRAQQFKGSPQHIVFTVDDRLSVNNSFFMASFWIKPDSNTTTENQSIFIQKNNGYGLHLNNNNQWVFSVSMPDSNGDSCSAPAIFNEWTLISFIRKESSYYFFVNDLPVDSFFINTTEPVYNDENSQIISGCSTNNSNCFSGVMDELRISNKPISELWIRLCYLTQRKGQNVVNIERIR